MEEKNAIFRPFRQVLAKLAWLGVIGEDEKKHLEKVDELKNKITSNNRLMEQMEQHLKENQILQGLQDDCVFYQ